MSRPSHGLKTSSAWLWGSQGDGYPDSRQVRALHPARRHRRHHRVPLELRRYNIGSAAQFSENTFFTNKGSSSYNALLFTLQKNLSHGLQFDFNYTFAHSIDNVSFFANSQGDTGIGGVGLICDDIRPRECRANSDFDVTHYITGRRNLPAPLRQAPEVPRWHSALGGRTHRRLGYQRRHRMAHWHGLGDNANAFDAGYSNNAPGILIGSPAAVATHLTKIPGGGVNVFNAADNADLCRGSCV